MILRVKSYQSRDHYFIFGNLLSNICQRALTVILENDRTKYMA